MYRLNVLPQLDQVIVMILICITAIIVPMLLLILPEGHIINLTVLGIVILCGILLYHYACKADKLLKEE